MRSRVNLGYGLTITDIRPLAHIQGACAFLLVLRLFYSLSQLHLVMASNPSLGNISPRSTGGQSEGTQEPRKMAA